MSFFTSSLALTLASLFDVSGQDNINKEQTQLDDFSAIQKELFKQESTRPMVQGVVAINLKSVTLFPVLGETKFRNIYCNLTNRNYSRKSRVLLKENVLLWNEIHHFPVNAVLHSMHPFNLLKISLMGFSASRPEIKVEIGQVSFHIHSIIKAAPIAGSYFLWNNNSQVGSVDVEITFSYGRFGYGYSYQLKEEDTNPSEKINYSLFPRINPSYSECDKGEAILEFKINKVPVVLQDCEPVEFNVCKEIKSMDMKEESYYPTLLMKEMHHLNDVKKQYFSTNDRVSRLLFLSNYLTSAKNATETVLESSVIPQKPEISSKKYLQYVVSTNEHLTKLKLAENNEDLGKKSSLYEASRAVFSKMKKNVEEDDSPNEKAHRIGDVKKTRLDDSEEETPKGWKFINLSKNSKVHPSNENN